MSQGCSVPDPGCAHWCAVGALDRRHRSGEEIEAVIEDCAGFGGNYSNTVRTLSGGRPIAARSPQNTMGRSIRIGFFTMARIKVSSSLISTSPNSLYRASWVIAQVRNDCSEGVGHTTLGCRRAARLRPPGRTWSAFRRRHSVSGRKCRRTSVRRNCSGSGGC